MNRSGEKASMFGRKLSPETIAKRSEARRLKRLSDPNYGGYTGDSMKRRQATRKRKKLENPNYGPTSEKLKGINKKI